MQTLNQILFSFSQIDTTCIYLRKLPCLYDTTMHACMIQPCLYHTSMVVEVTIFWRIFLKVYNAASKPEINFEKKTHLMFNELKKKDIIWCKHQ